MMISKERVSFLNIVPYTLASISNALTFSLAIELHNPFVVAPICNWSVGLVYSETNGVH